MDNEFLLVLNMTQCRNRQLSTLLLLLLATCGFLAEEWFYLAQHPFSLIVGNTLTERYASCHPENHKDGYVAARCDLAGYHSALFLCKRRLCFPKEPANGSTITKMEETWVDQSVSQFLGKSSSGEVAESGFSESDRNR